MKKLLSICFLSILLGLLSFSTQAQSNTGSSCASGFWIENLQPTTIHEIANLPADMPNTGDLPLTHTLGQLWYGSTGQYLGNAHPGQTELYELHFCNTCNLPLKTKVSIDWLVIRNGDTINDHLSDFMELGIYTFYNQLNQYGECQSIPWLGGQVPDQLGYCNQVSGNYTLYDSIHGLNSGCNTPTNYPGAMQVAQGLPYSFATDLGLVLPAMGMTPIYTQALDYFYLDFFLASRTIVQIKWKQVGDYKLVMRIRERQGGTAYNNLNWNNNETTDFIGGHQSCCGPVIAEDVIGFPTFGSMAKAVCTDVTWDFGRPNYTFNADHANRNYDTNVVFGQYVFDGTDCKYFQTDSIYYADFYVRHTPVVTVHDQTLCKCDNVDILASVTEDLVGLDDTQSSKRLEWYYNNKWNTTLRYRTYAKVGDDSVYYYRVRQVNTYNDTLECEGPQADFTVTIKEMLAPQINAPAVVDFCREALNGVTLTATATPQDNCGTTIRWYTSLNSLQQGWLENGTLTPANYFTSYINTNTLLSGASLSVNLADYKPSTNKDTTIYFFAVSYNETQQCSSRKFDYFTVTIHQTPVLAKATSPATNNCPGAEVEMQVKINNGTSYSAPDYTYMWSGDVTSVKINGTKVPFAGATEKTIGTSTGTTTYYPFYNNRKYCYSQQIYTKDEIGKGLITKIAFYNTKANITRNNVKVSFAETNLDNFGLNTNTWITDGLTEVYSGSVSATQAGWVTITLDEPYLYDGTKNLVVALNDASSTTANAQFRVSDAPGATSPSYYKTLYISNANNPVGPTGSGTHVAKRSNIMFTMESLDYAASAKNQYAYYQIPGTDACNTEYSTSVYVIDGNGCTSEPVEFQFKLKDEVAPTVSTPSKTVTVYDCDFTTTNAPVYTTLAELEAGAGITFSDACGHDYLTLNPDSTIISAVTTNDKCEKSKSHTYMVFDRCGNKVVFTHNFVTKDNQAPQFVQTAGQPLYVRMAPLQAANCTYDAPDKAAFVNAILGKVTDNCTTMDFDWLMANADFYWENSESLGKVLAPGTQNIFRDIDPNQLTVRVVVKDCAGNQNSGLVIYFNRPQAMTIANSAITIVPANICLGETATLTFDPTKVITDPDFPTPTLTYAWSNVEGQVEVADATALTTTVTPTTGDMTYNFKMTVTDEYGCSATSQQQGLFVKANPNPMIVLDPRNVGSEPFCPSAGVLYVEVVDAVTGTQIPNLTYTWTELESVDFHSTNDTARFYVVPTLCNHDYTLEVNVVDNTYGCTGHATRTIEVRDSLPTYTGEPHIDTVTIMTDCKMYVPDFTHYLNSTNVVGCGWPFSSYGITQSPAANTPMTDDTPVTIYITSPCSPNERAEITGMFKAAVPAHKISVTASANPTSGCEPTTFEFTATAQHAVGTVNYTWKRGTVVVSNAATFTRAESVPAGDTVANYTYNVKAVDAANSCESNASVTVTVYHVVDAVDYVTYDNHNCTSPWDGILQVNNAPKNYIYELRNTSGFYMIRTSEVPGHDSQVSENTRIFDNLQEGDYTLTVTTPRNCPNTFPIHIGENKPTVTMTAAEVSFTAPTVCTQDDATITINALPGYSYQVYNSSDELLVAPYQGLHSGSYKIVKTSTATRCVAPDYTINIPDYINSRKFSVASGVNTLCGGVNYNGSITLATEGWEYTVKNSSDVVMTAPYNNLQPGAYSIHGSHTASGCTWDTNNVVVGNNTVNPDFTVTTDPNNYCANAENLVNGKLNITNLSSYQFTVTSGSATIAAPYENLPAGDYHIKAVNTTNQCSTEKDATIYDEIYMPTASATATANTSCDPAVLAYNGSATISVAADVASVVIAGAVCDYTVNLQNGPSYGWNGASLQFIQNSVVIGEFTLPSNKDNLNYTVSLPSGILTTIVYSPGSISSQNRFTVKDQSGNVVWSKDRFDMNLGGTKVITPNCSSVNPVTAFNNKIQPYTITFNGETSTQTTSPVTYNGLNFGSYSYTVKTKYLCELTTPGSIDVPQAATAVLSESSTPNTLCVGTLNHPGNGTIKIESITPMYVATSLNDYDYTFYYATPTLDKGDQLSVSYMEPITKTMYHLTDTIYYVQAYNTKTGCTIHDTCRVHFGVNTVNIAATTTADKFCTKNHNGTITVTATPVKYDGTPNTDAVLMYSIDNTTFQASNVFTGVKHGTYTIYVKDVTTGCVYPSAVTYDVDLAPNDIAIAPTITNNTACDANLYNGALTAVASTTTFEGASFLYKINYTGHTETEFTATNTWTNLGPDSYTVTVEEQTSGCTLDSTFTIVTQNICAPVVNVTSVNHNNDEFHFCRYQADAKLCATATDPNCGSTEFTYRWVQSCHNDTVYNSCIDILTNDVHHCTYTVLVTSVLTGCQTTVTKDVVIDMNPTISYLVQTYDPAHLYNPFVADPNTFYNCENKDVKLGVDPTKSTPNLVSAVWSMDHVGTGFDFMVPANSIAGGTFSTYCVDVVDANGCKAKGQINLFTKPVPKDTIRETNVCHSWTCPNTAVHAYTLTYNPSTTYPVSHTDVLTAANGCDSIVTYEISLIDAPVITGTPTVAAFCQDEDKTLADFEGYTVNWNGATGTEKWYHATGTGAYTKVTSVSQITDGNYVITNQYGTKAMSSVSATGSAGTYLTDPAANLTDPSTETIWTITKNSDNTYSIYSPSINKYVAGLTSNAVQLVDNNTAPNAKWNISITSGNVSIVNVQHGTRYLKYNTSSPRFASYFSGTDNTVWLSLYKAPAGAYTEVASTQPITYHYVTTHTIKRVVSNSCGSDEEILDLHDKVFNKPDVVALPTVNPYCDGQDYTFTATLTSYGTQGAAQLFANGVQIGTEKTFTGANQTVNFGTITVTATEHDGKNLTLKVYNKNGQCDTVRVDSVMHVFSTSFPTITNNASPYCVGGQIDLGDFDNIPAGYINQTVWVKGSPDYELTPLPYALTNRALNDAQLYVKADASTCFTGLVSDPVTIKVNDKPSFSTLADIDVCASAFALTAPTVTNNGSTVTAQGWQMSVSSVWTNKTADEIKAAARDNHVSVRYYATNDCGTAYSNVIDVLVNDKPQVTLSANDMCPNSKISVALTSNIVYHNIGGIGNYSYYRVVKGTNTQIVDVDALNASAISTLYQGGKLWLVAGNDCGKDSASITINVLTNDFTAPAYQPACDGDQLSNFIATNPSWTGSASVGSTGKWQIKIGSTTTDATLATVIHYADNPQVAYTWTTQCGDVVTTTFTSLTINKKPELTMKAVAAVCANQSINPATAINTITYYGNADKYDTTYTVDGVAITPTTPLTDAYNGKYLVVTLNDNGQACGVVKDSVVITVNPLPNPTISGPAKACADAALSAPFVAGTGFVNYQFTVVGNATPTPATQNGPSNIYNPTFGLSTPLSVAFDTIYVTATDNKGCVGTSSNPAVIRVTNAPSFIFKTMGGTETHEYSSTVGNGLQYTWEVNTDCYNPDHLVYVEYDIYYNNVLIPNSQIGLYLNTQHSVASPGHPAKDYVTSNAFSWCASDGNHRSDEILYNYSSANPSVAESGNHFPYSHLNLGTGHNYFDDLWLSFLADRQVTKTYVPFLAGGEYKVVYRLMATSNNQQLNEYYSPTCAPISDLIPIGGHSSLASGYTRTLLAIDSVTIHVDGPSLTPSADPVADESAPEVAPAIQMDEAVSPDMEVWPNPAPAVETTLKARVHNMFGEATVTLTSLTGKQVYNGEIFIDNDNYYFEFNVNSLSVGSYIMTVRTDADVITKKVIVSRLAK